MSNRKLRAAIAKDSLAIMGSGRYTAPSGATVHIKNSLSTAIEGSVLYEPEMLPISSNGESNDSSVSTGIRVHNMTTLAAAKELLQRHPQVACLNFASAKHPGGGFRNGSLAQEESLALASGLYACIGPQQKMYQANLAHSSCLYLDYMIYSPDVPVFRDDDLNLIEEPWPVSIVTAPAVNAGAVKPRERDQIEPTMISRIEKVLSVFAAQNQRALVLGAWGCGVFKNVPLQVAQWFHHHLVDNPRFQHAFDEVSFAVLDRTKDRKVIRPFQQVFRT